MAGQVYAVHYLRPDGWWEAGRGWGTAEDALRDAIGQLPASVERRVVLIDADSEPLEAGTQAGEVEGWRVMAEQKLTIASDEDSELGFILVAPDTPQDQDELLRLFAAQVREDWAMTGDVADLRLSGPKPYVLDEAGEAYVPCDESEAATDWWYTVTGLDAWSYE